MASRRGITCGAVLGLFILVASIEATQLSRDESREDQRTEFNLASTLTGGISSSRHRQGALLNTNLYPPLGLVGAGGGYTGAAGSVGSSGSIDAAHGHESGGSGVRLASTNNVVFPGAHSPNPGVTIAGGQPAPAYPPPGFPGQQVPVPYPTAPAYPAGGASYPGVPAVYPASSGPAAYPAMGAPQPPVQLPGSVPAQPGVAPGYYPGYPYPGTYLPQYPAYPQPAQLPAYGVAPGAAVYPPATSTQNVHRYPDHNPRDPNHWDHHFSMNTEYKEDGVHKGAFGVLNNHNAFGYGSGYGGGYNGAFNSGAI
ncbi:uncharacterized protein Dana_GF16999, isoform B [Drosophila ananassae]|uniref:Uncharacterized protein, isoform B n=1 Tax=Drosophila ananassae TaxID=7217 RepID=A0A0N8P1F1_DROAN|nr:splicing factor, proline- and glutamine-rich isoform X1 [Drosophila ananassae]KPU79748.1 uncharacterized protein Dana_GF16999, isoform B [Drosophila ananassae]